ncbi:MAG: hypothetical protein JWM40_2899 [Frankiales bacterium]|nr:hypothetical protein [Frankiales bacterium]
MSVPDPLGRDRLAAGAASYKKPVYGVKPEKPPFYLRWRYISLAVVGALLLSYVLYKATTKTEDTPDRAASQVIALFLDSKFSELRAKLCREDRDQVGATDLERAGRSAGDLLRTLDKPQVESVTPIALTGRYAGVDARQVSGLITGVVGAGTTFHVVTVDEKGWRVCLSPGGYGVDALNLDVPVGGALEGVS